MNASGDDGRPTDEVSLRGVDRVGAAAAAATTLVFIPVFVRNPSTAEEVPPGWLVALILAAPLSAYLVSRLLGIVLSVPLSLLAGLPQVPLVVLLSAAAILLDVQRGHLMDGMVAMAFAIGTPIAFAAGIILLALVAAGTKLGARPRRTKKRLRRSLPG